MDISWILDNLNGPQCEAVMAPLGSLCVLAGAGSGKTRVLTRRIVWLLTVEKVSPESILAVTFTNKAAVEMRVRVEALLDRPVNNLWIGTFHGIAYRLLRQHWQAASLPYTFRILDSSNQIRLLRKVFRELNLDERSHLRSVKSFIDRCKDEGQRPTDLLIKNDRILCQKQSVYAIYQQHCERSGVVDFGELLLRVYELMHDDPDFLAYYQKRFSHLLVDEFQDTNAIQYQWIRLLGGNKGNVFIVGDDDQCVYGWRGSQVENIQRFTEDFPGVRTIHLEQNYRSTHNILRAANALISYNTNRLGKKLWTADGDGALINFYNAHNEVDEAFFVVKRIRQWVADGGRCSDVAILYRTNVQAKLFEETLITAALPYRVYGGLSFFERAEIRDVLAYLSLVANRHNDQAFEQVVNTPLRGIGERTLEILKESAQGSSLWQAAQQLLSTSRLSRPSAIAVRNFLTLIERLDAQSLEQSVSFSERVSYIIHHSGLLAMYKGIKTVKGKERIKNLEALVKTCNAFILSTDLVLAGVNPTESDWLNSFLSYVVLESSLEAVSVSKEDKVQLMTLHMAKGLEFPLVFMVGLEEGLFPYNGADNEVSELEEERRLAYVGITRARYQLYMSCAGRRSLFGGLEKCSLPSRFSSEIPPDLTRTIQPSKSYFSQRLQSVPSSFLH